MSESASWLGEYSDVTTAVTTEQNVGIHQTMPTVCKKDRLARSILLGLPLVDLCLHIASSGLLLRQTGWIDRVGDLTYLLRYEGDFELDHT